MPVKKLDINTDDIRQLIENARFLKSKDPAQAIEFLENALAISKEAKYPSGIASSLKELGHTHLVKKDYTKAISFYLEAISNFEKLDDNLHLHLCNNELSEIYLLLSDYELALEKQLIAISHAKKLNDKPATGIAYNKIGGIYKFLAEYRKAIEQHFFALKIFEELNDKRQLNQTNFFIGNCYNWVNELDMARNHLEKSLSLAEEIGDPQLKVRPMGSLAILLTKQKNYDKALTYFSESIETVNLTDNKSVRADLLKSLGKLYIETGNFQKAVETLNEALQITDELKVKFPANIIHQFLAEAYEKKKDYQKALYHHQQYMAICREINNEEISLKTTGIHLKYDLDKIKKEKEIAEKSAKLKDQFLSNISHEIRTPLNGISGMVSLLTETNPSAEQLEYINTIKLSLNNLLVIINDLFDYSKISTGKIQFDEQEFKFKEIISTLVQMSKVRADEKNLKLSLFIDDSIPDLLIGDQLRLNQILFNLLNNAIKFTDKGFVKLEIKKLKEDDNKIKLLFSVSDTGAGIPEDRIPTIFESFTHQKLMETGKEGTGLGLTITKQLVDLQGGNITLNSKINSGSIFKVELAFGIPKKSIGRKATPGQVSVEPRDLSLISVLLVEDNKVNQFLAKQLLARMGFKVDIAGNATAALEQLSKKEFDIILMDVQMPGMTGYELCQHIRSQLQPPVNQIPIIALTAYASMQEREKALSFGMSDYVSKPYSPQELLTVILKHVKKESAVLPEELPDGKVEMDSDPVQNLFTLMGKNKDNLIGLIKLFLEQIPALNKSLEESIMSNNTDDTFQIAHKLKSSVGLLKITELSDSINAIEEAACSGETAEILTRLFKKYSAVSRKTITLLKAELEKLKAD
ncbi:MAG: tetratricopeptide repeat protein [Bacteroidia bacterium]